MSTERKKAYAQQHLNLESVQNRMGETNAVKVPPCIAALRGRPILSEASLTVQIDWGCQEDNLFGGVTAGSDPRAISDSNGLQSNIPFSSKHPVDEVFIEAADAMKESDHWDGADEEKRMLQKSTRVEKGPNEDEAVQVSIVSCLGYRRYHHWIAFPLCHHMSLMTGGHPPPMPDFCCLKRITLLCGNKFLILLSSLLTRRPC